MTHDPGSFRDMILLLQAEMDGELGEIAEHAEAALRRASPECQAAFNVVSIAHAMRARLTHHALPAKARRRLLQRLRAPRE